MLVSGVAAIVLVLLQESNSDGTSALSGGSASDSDSFYGKNKGKRIEAKLKTWTFVSAIALAVFSIVFFILGQ